ncbi:glucosidase 2 subunit beta-like isoform X1 [Haliotis rufescens]|uniref:glucosidase 2 subunit beta-like isoform X1 n=1 Tax=Haliotis rufescens TaxID=6454 RepID=UPI001EB012C8|nr:glucosidase 2 subunit beta-like isoform X1 [Haliotis rufescens]
MLRKMSAMSLSVLSVVVTILVVEGAIERPRGVPLARASLYQPRAGNTFKCLTSGTEIPFEYVNDDYCDCDDGTDEPGTAACPNMKFFCQNRGHVAEDILSSRVNDGICDCCDGSDEYQQEKIQCTNTCDELGRKRREDLLREKELREAGFNIRKQYVEEGLQNLQTNKDLVEDLEKSKEQLTTDREVLEGRKMEVESPEKEAKETHEKAWEAVKAERQAARDKLKAAQAFEQLDRNRDTYVDTSEMMSHPEFDIDSDGTVSEEEAKEYLEDQERSTEEEFVEKIWPNIKEIYKPPVEASETKGDEDVTPPTATDAVKPPSISSDRKQVPPPLEDIPEGGAPDDIEDEDEDGSEDEEDEDDYNIPTEEEKKTEEEEEEKMPDYHEETKRLIEVADEARRLYDEADKKVKDVESQISNAKKYLDKDFGPENEYAFLYNKCFEYTEREYTYKLCPFDKASQRPKSGGSETNLGLWGHWDGTSNDKYSAQKYEKGQNCWNGPDRSVKILLQCGTDNQLLSAAEPSRCEYQFEFATPARCTHPTPEEYQMNSGHDEL